MSSFVKPSEIEAEAGRRQEELRAKYVVDTKRVRQHTLAGNTLNKKVHDIVPFPDANGDDIVLFVFIEPRQSDFKPNEKAIVMIVLSEPHRQKVYFDEVMVKEARYYQPDGTLLVLALRNGTYNY